MHTSVETSHSRALFKSNLAGQKTSRVPIWIMRQAGRYLPEYREVRSRMGFEEMCKDPEVASQVTVMPIDKFGFDAAVIFSDILYIVEPFGFDLRYNPAPKIAPLLENPDQSKMFEQFDPAEKLAFVSEVVRATRIRLGDSRAVIGFCGAPFTVFSFLCGYMGAKEMYRPYAYLMKYPKEAEHILTTLAEISLEYLKMQARAGADYVQVFDTAAGELSEAEFRRFSMPYLKYIFEGLKSSKIPSGLYIKNSNHLLDAVSELPLSSFCVDWKTPLKTASEKLKPVSLQGNLNPNLMIGPKEKVEREAVRILNEMADYPGFIFNLGHGILPPTPEENVRRLVATVRAFRAGKAQ